MQSYRNPKAQWRGSPNFTLNRSGHDMTQPSWVVLHTMVGSESNANQRFQISTQQASANYGICLDGSIVQWVDEKDSAWANGNSGTGARGDNLDSISIEHEDNGDYNGPRTPELYSASAELVRDICLRYSIPIDRNHIIGHRECGGNAPTACPDALDMDRIVALAVSSNTSSSQGDELTVEQDQLIRQIFNMLFYGADGRLPNLPFTTVMLNTLKGEGDALPTQLTALTTTLLSVKTELDSVKKEVEAGGSVDAASAIARIETALKGA